jgi:predicted nuclease of predicted toxin-antitoxin system
MHLLANENVPRPTVEALRAAGHDVIWARTDIPGSSDEEILSRAQADGRVLLMHDKDFGELAYHAGLPASCGIILIRLSKLALAARIAPRNALY